MSTNQLLLEAIALARLVKDRQPKLWDFSLRLRRKDAVIDEMASATMRWVVLWFMVCSG